MLLRGGCTKGCSVMGLTKQQRNCARKEALTKKEATATATAKAQLRSVQKNITLHTYFCDVCGWWHLTKSPANWSPPHVQ